MTVSTTTSTAQFAPNGVTINFPFAFRFFAATDLKVFWQKPDGTIQLLILNSNYTVQGAGNNAGGSITTIGTPLPNGLLVVSRIMVATQLTSFRNQGEFFAEIHEDAFDKLVMLVQQTLDSQGRGLTVPVADPLGINLVLPGAGTRAGKALAFDQEGQPVVSTLTLEQIEQQPALALESAAKAKAWAEAEEGVQVEPGKFSAKAWAANANYNAGLADDSRIAAQDAEAAAKNAEVVSRSAGVQLGMSMWGFRPQPFQGFALDDGQELDRAVYPSFAAALDAGLLPTVTQAQWNADPGNRACFVANSSAGKFRMRDRNGMSPGSYGAVFERGGSGPTLIKRDQMQSHKHRTVSRGDDAANFVDGVDTTAGAISSTSPAGASTSNRSLSGLPYTGPNVGDVPAGGGARHGSETYPTHATGAWMTRLFGVITPLGSAEAASLATAYASLATRLMAVETLPRFRRWRSANLSLSVTAAGYAHALGFVPDVINVHVTLTVSVGGWPIGVAFRMSPQGTDIGPPNSYGIQVCNLDASSFSANCASSGILINTTTGAQIAVTLAQCTVQVELLAWA